MHNLKDSIPHTHFKEKLNRFFQNKNVYLPTKLEILGYLDTFLEL